MFDQIYKELSIIMNLLNQDFKELDFYKQIEILIKLIFLYSSELENLITKNEEEKETFSNELKNTQSLYMQKIEILKSENYSLQCEKDDLKIKYNSLKTKISKDEIEIKNVKEKYYKLKDKLRQEENIKQRIEVDYEELDIKYKNLLNEIENLNKKIIENENKFSDERKELKIKIEEKEGHIGLIKHQNEMINMNFIKLKERNEYLETINKSNNINNNSSNNDNDDILNILGITNNKDNKNDNINLNSIKKAHLMSNNYIINNEIKIDLEKTNTNNFVSSNQNLFTVDTNNNNTFNNQNTTNISNHKK